jgi:hypothetical protein
VARETDPENAHGKPAWLFWAALGAIGVGSGLRLLGCFNDLWLDEIWAIRLVEGLRSPLEVLTQLRIDNHVLYSMYLQLVGPDAADWVYRLPSWLCGTASLVLVFAAARVQLAAVGARRDDEGARLALASVLLVGSSSLMIQFDSEARGYGPALMFVLLGWVLLLRNEGLGWSRSVPAYWISGALGLLAQPIAIHALVAAVCWSGVRAWRREGGRASLLGCALWHGPVMLFAGVFYLAYVSQLQSGGGPDHTALWILHGVSLQVLGVPDGWHAVATPTLVVLALASCVAIARRRDDVWIYFVVGSVVSPVVFAWALDLRYHFIRYQLVGVVLLTLLLARGLAFPYRHPMARGLAALLCVGIVLGNLARVSDFLTWGRGSYRVALERALAGTPSGPVRIGSDHDFRNGMLIAYHQQRVPGGERIEYLPREAWTAEEPAWFVQQMPLFQVAFADHVRIRPGGAAYTLEEILPTSGVSGSGWLLYRRASAP